MPARLVITPTPLIFQQGLSNRLPPLIKGLFRVCVFKFSFRHCLTASHSHLGIRLNSLPLTTITAHSSNYRHQLLVAFEIFISMFGQHAAFPWRPSPPFSCSATYNGTKFYEIRVLRPRLVKKHPMHSLKFLWSVFLLLSISNLMLLLFFSYRWAATILIAWVPRSLIILLHIHQPTASCMLHSYHQSCSPVYFLYI